MGTTAPFFVQTFHYPDGRPLAGGKINFWVAGSTSLPKQVFSDIGLTIPLTQPVMLDASGTAPQYFLEPGLYKIQVRSSADVLIQTRDNVEGGGGSGGEDSYQVKTTSGDAVPAYLSQKVLDSATVTWTTVNDGGSTKLQATVDAANTRDYKVKATSSDATPGFLDAKIADTATIELDIVADKLQATYIGPDKVSVASGEAAGYLEDVLEDSATVTWTTEDDKLQAHVEAGAGDTYKVKRSTGDTIPGFLGDKIKAGTGVTFTQTTDGVNGEVMHVNVQNTDGGKVKVDADDLSLGYLGAKLAAGSNITLIRETIPGGDALLRISAFAAGSLGYEADVKDFANAISIGSSTAIQNVCQVSLDAGTWDVTGSVSAYTVQTGLPVQVRCNISDVSATVSYDGYENWTNRNDTGGGASITGVVSSKRYVLSVPTTIYLCAQAASGTFTGGLMWGNLTARQAA